MSEYRPMLVVYALALAAWGLPSRSPASDGSSDTGLHPVRQQRFCVTNGVLSTRADGKLAIDTASSRAVMRQSAGQIAEIRFRYLGPTAQSKPLASGEMRRQIGIKLRARDTCNLLYVMWHIEPDGKIGVSVKSNPGKHAHSECHADGYTTLRPRFSVPVPRVLPGDAHTLRAELRGNDVTVSVDGGTVWAGSVGDRIQAIDGPVGFRTDNGRFAFEYLARDLDAGTTRREADQGLYHCEVGPGD